MSTVTDCYQPVERRLGLNRRCLEVLAEFRQPVGIITKNHLVTRDIDLLKKLAAHDAALGVASGAAHVLLPEPVAVPTLWRSRTRPD